MLMQAFELLDNNVISKHRTLQIPLLLMSFILSKAVKPPTLTFFHGVTLGFKLINLNSY